MKNHREFILILMSIHLITHRHHGLIKVILIVIPEVIEKVNK